MGDARQHVEQAQSLLDEAAHERTNSRAMFMLYKAVTEQQAALVSLVEQLEPRPFRTHSAETR